jgi:uncharacterized protein (TIGR03382 family)
MAFRKASYLIPSCDGCGLAWSFFDPACAYGIPPHFADRATALEQLARDYGWQVDSVRFSRPLMACRACAAAGVIPAGAFLGWLLAVAGWVRRLVPFGPIRQPLLPGPGEGHPESLTAELPPEDEELLAAMEDEKFPEP